jgi:hypothetical protein
MPLLSVAWSQATNHLSDLWSEGRLADDFVALVLAEARLLEETPEMCDSIEQQVLESKTERLDTHPSTSDRLRAIEARELPPRMTHPSPGSILFQEFGPLCKEMTIEFYASVLGDQPDPGVLVPTRMVVDERRAAVAKNKTPDLFHFGTRLLLVGVFPVARPVSVEEMSHARARLDSLRQDMKEGAPEFETVIDELDELAERRRKAALYARCHTIRKRLDPSSYGLTADEADDIDVVMDDLNTERETLLEKLAKARSLSEERIGLAAAVASTPDVIAELSRETVTIARLPQLFTALSALEMQWPAMRRLQQALIELMYLYGLEKPTLEPGPVRRQYTQLWKILRTEMTALKSATAEIEYPYEHGRESIDLGEYLFEAVPRGGSALEPVAREGMGRFLTVYFRIWTDLTALALEVEEALGLPEIEENL